MRKFPRVGAEFFDYCIPRVWQFVLHLLHELGLVSISIHRRNQPTRSPSPENQVATVEDFNVAILFDVLRGLLWFATKKNNKEGGTHKVFSLRKVAGRSAGFKGAGGH